MSTVPIEPADRPRQGHGMSRGIAHGLVLAAFLFPCGSVDGAPPTLVADLDTVAVNGSSLGPGVEPRVVAVDGIGYFAARTDETGIELWRTDGTGIGTTLVRDLCPGPCDSEPRSLTAHDGTLYFTASDGVFGRELWSSDGTAAGTRQILDICRGACGGLEVPFSGPIMTSFGGRLYFPAFEPGTGNELWSTDGTAAGTSLLLDLCPGACNANARPGVVLDSWFTVTTGPNARRALYSTDGTASGFEQLMRRLPGSQFAFGDTVYFSRFESDLGWEIWRSDGTAAGTRMVADFCPGRCSSAFALPFVGVFEDRLYIALAPSGAITGTALYRIHDAADTFDLVRAQAWPSRSFAALDDAFYFGSRGACRGLWKSDGTAVGTRIVDCAGTALEMVRRSSRQLVFVAEGSIMALSSDGDLSTLATFPVGNGVATPESLKRFDDEVIFEAADLEIGREPWVTDGTPEGTRPLADLAQDPGSTAPRRLTRIGDRLIFDGRDAAERGVYVSDGSAAGTTKLPFGPETANAFFADDGGVIGPGVALYTASAEAIEYGTEERGLWRTDGTPIGTRRISPAPYAASDFRRIGDRIYFAAVSENADGDSIGSEPWVTDGTESGTHLVRDIGTFFGAAINPFPPPSSFPHDFEVAGDTVVFVANRDLWRTDGTVDGTVQVAEINGDDPALPRELTPVAGRVVFSATAAASGREPWVTDGTEAGTRLLRDLVAGEGDGAPHHFIEAGRIAVFFATEGVADESFWVTDGTAAGTRKISDLGDRPGFVTDATRIGKRFFFTFVTEAHGSELWTSDGSIVGTRPLAEIVGGPIGGYPTGLMAIDDTLVFAAADLEHGLELWMLDADLVPTRLTDLRTGPLPSAPSELRRVGDRLFFSAFGDGAGRELWSLPWPPDQARNPPSATKMEPVVKLESSDAR